MRKSEVVVVPAKDGNRDSGKHFLITEMSAMEAEKWAMRAILMLKGSGERLPDNVQGLGMIGVAILGLNVFLQGTIKAGDLEPLMDEMMTCVKMVRDPRTPGVATDIVSPDDIEEVSTRLWLRSEVLRVHTGFSPADALSKLIESIQAPASSLQSTSTSPRPSGPRSRRTSPSPDLLDRASG